MDRGLYKDDVLVTEYTKSVSRPVTTKVVNRLLNGESHVQTIGDPRFIVDVDLLATKEQRQTIDGAVATGAHLVASDGDDWWEGISTAEELSWQEIFEGKGIYRTTLTLDVQTTSEVVVE